MVVGLLLGFSEVGISEVINGLRLRAQGPSSNPGKNGRSPTYLTGHP